MKCNQQSAAGGSCHGLSAHPRAELRGRGRGTMAQKSRGSRGAAGQQGSRRGQVARLLRGALRAPAECALERAAVVGRARAAARAVRARAVRAPEDLAARRTVDVEEQPDLACPGHGRGRQIRQGTDLLRPRDRRALSRRALRGRDAFEPREKGAQTAQQSSRGRKCNLAPAPGGGAPAGGSLRTRATTIASCRARRAPRTPSPRGSPTPR